VAKTIPDDATLDEVIEILRFKSKVIEGLRQLDAGEGIPHKEMVKRVDKWFSK
jgi:predicted transcriptional regulator